MFGFPGARVGGKPTLGNELRVVLPPAYVKTLIRWRFGEDKRSALAAVAALQAHLGEGGGRRIMLVCGVPGCAAQFAAGKRALERAGVDVTLVDTRTGRHNLDGAMMKALHDAWPQLVAATRAGTGFCPAAIDDSSTATTSSARRPA